MKLYDALLFLCFGVSLLALVTRAFNVVVVPNQIMFIVILVTLWVSLVKVG